MPFNRRVRKLLKRHFRDFIEQQSYGSTTDANAAARDILDRCAVDGKIGVILSGRDCDCVSYHREYVMDAPPSVIEFKRYWDKHVEWLDGPESQTFVRPDKIDRTQNFSRDLVLEAHEDGHPHVIYDRSY